MRIVKIIGGLGNQMFQYAFGQALQNKTNENILYHMDESFNEEQSEGSKKIITKRKFNLDFFNVRANFLEEKYVKFLKKKSKFSRLIDRLLNNEDEIIIKFVKEEYIGVFDLRLFNQRSKNLYYHEYYQTDKYFSDIRDQILQDFTLKNDLDEEN